MAKTTKKTTKSTLEIWLDVMREKYPDAVTHFESFLIQWDFPTIGGAFAQLQSSFDVIAIYLKTNAAPDTTKSMEPIKSSLEIAFRRSQAINNELVCTPGIYNTVVNKPVAARSC